jgi:hypothetical protein
MLGSALCILLFWMQIIIPVLTVGFESKSMHHTKGSLNKSMFSQENESIEADNDYLETMKLRMRGNLPQKASTGLNIKKNLTQGIDNASGFEDSAQAIMDSAQRRQASMSSSGVRSPEVKSTSSQGGAKKQ